MKVKQFFNIVKNKKYLSPLIVISVFIFALLLDQLTKIFIISRCIPNVGDYIKVIPKVISFVYTKNYGAAWGILQNNTIFLIIMTFIGMGIMIAFYIIRLKKVENRASITFAVATGLIVGGAVGNLIDRLFLGYVRDFINFDFLYFPVFNFADAALSIGIIIMLVYILFLYSKEEKPVQNLEKNIKNTENIEKNDNFDLIIDKNDELQPKNDKEPTQVSEKKEDKNE